MCEISNRRRLFYWHPKLANQIKGQRRISLNSFLSFDNNQYSPGILNKIRQDANRDRKEYGFAQLRLVLVFLRWHNTKENPDERIVSPLLLLPVELTKKKGIRDDMILTPVSAVAEVNPALRYFLRLLYDLDLPEAVDLAETSLDIFHKILNEKIAASDPSITLKKIDKPQIQLVYESARKRMDDFRRRQRMSGRGVRNYADDIDYCYQPDNFQPLGLQLFLKRVQPVQSSYDKILNDKPRPRHPFITGAGSKPEGMDSAVKGKEFFTLRNGSGSNRYVWDFDLCSLTLANFNYRKMTLVRDFNEILDGELTNAAFDEIFSADVSEPPPASSLPSFNELYTIVPCDPTQMSAIGRAREGVSYIIQGPPGTGKSQTITNLIADFVGRGLKVLFVCEKRVAIDVVFHRLKQQGLDELAILIHDSQTDKKSFVMHLKETYERFKDYKPGHDLEKRRERLALGMNKHLHGLKQMDEVMGAEDEVLGQSLLALLQRLVELQPHCTELSVEECESLPHYRVWREHQNTVLHLAKSLRETGLAPIFAESPLRMLNTAAINHDTPVKAIRAGIDSALEHLDKVLSALKETDTPIDRWPTLKDVQTLSEYASVVHGLARQGWFEILSKSTAQRKSYDRLRRKYRRLDKKREEATAKTKKWTRKLTYRDAETALHKAQGFEGRLFRFINPGFWTLGKTLKSHYDFKAHNVTPSWTSILGELIDEYKAIEKIDEVRAEFKDEFNVDDPKKIETALESARDRLDTASHSIRDLHNDLLKNNDRADILTTLSDLREAVAALNETLSRFLYNHENYDLQGLRQRLTEIGESLEVFPELAPDLMAFCELPEDLQGAVRELHMTPEQLEAAMAIKSLETLYVQDRSLRRFDGRNLAARIEKVLKLYKRWMKINSDILRHRRKLDFQDHLQICSLPIARLTTEQKQRKQIFNEGRRILKHEFGKSMRYKSIRDIISGESGEVAMMLKPIWLMSPLSVSDTLTLNNSLFDVVIFDEASQIKVEEAIPALYRAPQVIVVGDEMQLPPTTFFSSSIGGDNSDYDDDDDSDSFELDADSFLTQSAERLPSTLLGWHYRSQHEALISFSNNAFYNGALLTIPDRNKPVENRDAIDVELPAEAVGHVDDLLERSVSYHFMENGVYAKRRNAVEAEYIAWLVRCILERDAGHSIGIVAFSEAQQDEIESALNRMSQDDAEFRRKLDAEIDREEDSQFIGLFVKNLENVQGDERDIIILSICYGYGPNGKMLMNFGPINKTGGEKRLNVIFSRAKKHMTVVASIRHYDITNEYNEGANCLKNYLNYAESVSIGLIQNADTILSGLPEISQPPSSRTSRSPLATALRDALTKRGYAVAERVGASRFRFDLAVSWPEDDQWQLGLLLDQLDNSADGSVLERLLMRPHVMQNFGWKVMQVLAKDWFHNSDAVLARIDRLMKGEVAEPERPPSEVFESSEIDPSVNHDNDNAVPADGQKDITEISAKQQGQSSVIDHEVRSNTDVPNASPIEPENEPTTAPTRPNKPSEIDSASLTQKPLYLECVTERHNKFWEIRLDGKAFYVRYGRIGTKGQSRRKEFSGHDRACEEASKLVREKMLKGYVRANSRDSE